MIHFDIDAAEVGKIRQTRHPVVGPLKLALPKLTRGDRVARERRTVRGAAAWLETVRGWHGEYPYKYRHAGPLKPQTVIERLRDLTAGEDVIWTTGVGQHQMWAMQYLQCEQPRTFITSGGLGTMGYGVPAAVGAKAARPDATVICIDGDGCFQMTCQELATAALERLADRRRDHQQRLARDGAPVAGALLRRALRRDAPDRELPDYAQLAEALGAAGFVRDARTTSMRRSAAALECGRTGGRRRPRRSGGELLPDGAGRRGSARHHRCRVAEEDNQWVEEGV